MLRNTPTEAMTAYSCQVMADRTTEGKKEWHPCFPEGLSLPHTAVAVLRSTLPPGALQTLFPLLHSLVKLVLFNAQLWSPFKAATLNAERTF